MTEHNLRLPSGEVERLESGALVKLIGIAGPTPNKAKIIQNQIEINRRAGRTGRFIRLT